MKVLTKEEEQRHYRAVVGGGFKGLTWGMALGVAGVWGASRRFPMFRQATLPLKAFLVMSSATFAGIIEADRGSAKFDMENNPEKARLAREEQEHEQQYEKTHTLSQRLKDWGREHRYQIVFGSWVASMAGSFALVNRNPYLSGAQKLVQARVYAQGLTLAVLIASFAIETNDANKGKGRWETVKVLDPNDPTHKHMIEKKIHHERYQGEDQWMEMVEAEEARLKEKEQRKEAEAKKMAQQQKKANSEKKEAPKEKDQKDQKESKSSEKN